MVLGGLCVVAVGIAARYYWGTDRPAPTRRHAPIVAGRRAAPARRERPRAARQAAGRRPEQRRRLKIVATVNGEEITREDLAGECLRHYGKEVLESLVNKHLIRQECQRRNIAVTRAEVNAEIKRMAERFRLPVDQWLKMLEQERGISPTQYASDIIWPTLALRKLAGQQLEVTQQELRRAVRDAVRRGGQGPADRLRRPRDGRGGPRRRGGQARPVRQAGQGALDRRPQRQPRRADPADPQAHGPKEIEQAAFEMAGRRDLAGDPGGRPVRDPQARRRSSRPSEVAFEQVKMGMIEAIRDGKMRRVARRDLPPAAGSGARSRTC